MPSGPGDYQDFLRFQAQAGNLLINEGFGTNWPSDFTSPFYYVGPYQKLGVAMFTGGTAADITVTLKFYDDSAGAVLVSQRTLRLDEQTQIGASVSVVGNFMRYTLQASAGYPRNRTFQLYAFAWPIDGIDMIQGQQSISVSSGGFATGGTVATVLTTVSNTPFVLAATTTAAPAICELQQRTTSAAAYTTRAVVQLPAGTLSGMCLGRMDCLQTRLLFTNNSGATATVVANINYGIA